MAEVTLAIGGNLYAVSCREGEQAHLLNMGAVIDAKALEARAAVGGLSETRQLLFAALLLADELNDARQQAQNHGDNAVSGDPDIAESLARLAIRIEAVASALEKPRG